MENIKEILSKVEKGELTSKEAASIIRSLPETKVQINYAKKIKIKIHDRENNKKIALPAIPIWLIEKIVLIVVPFANHANKKEAEPIKKGKTKIKAKDLKTVFSVLKHIPPCRLVDIDDEDAFVEIYMI